MLDLNELAKGLPAITPSFGTHLAEAGAVCFESQEHINGVILQVRGEYSAKYSVLWPTVTDQMLRCLNDPEVATELGAVGVAILLIQRLKGYTVVERSRKGTGFDYWLGNDDNLFQNKARLEISGIRCGDQSQVTTRVKAKVNQVSPSNNQGLPAYVVVVEFGIPLAEVREVRIK